MYRSPLICAIDIPRGSFGRICKLSEAPAPQEAQEICFRREHTMHSMRHYPPLLPDRPPAHEEEVELRTPLSQEIARLELDIIECSLRVAFLRDLESELQQSSSRGG